MRHRAGFVYAAVCAAGVAWLAGSGVTMRAAAGVISMAELVDIPLGLFHNGVFPLGADQIVDDHGVRFGSLGSDIFPGDSRNEFWAVTDRGPNGNPGRRTFVAPKFNPEILYVRVQSGRIIILKSLPILDAAGLPVSGLPNISGGFDEVPWNFNNTAQDVPYNPNGLDTEGIVRTADGHFWLVDEYSPSLLHVGPDGRIIDRFVPENSPLSTTLANTPNYRVRKFLPKILNTRRQNRGFEGIALAPDGRTLFVAMQSPLDYPTTALGRASRNVRIIRFDIGSEQVTGEFVYQFDEVCAFLGQAAGCPVIPGEMKVSAMAAVDGTSLLIDERTDTVAKIYRVNLNAATNILRSSWDDVAASPGATTAAVETLASPASQGITVLPKTLVADLTSYGLPTKIEGIAIVDGNTIAVANDNDFGLVDEATFDARGRLSNDTGARSRIYYIQLASPLF